jgi:hypothetical protein
VFCFNVLFVYLVVYVTCIVLTLPPGGQPICSTMMIIIMITKATRRNIPEDTILLLSGLSTKRSV